MPNTAFVPFLTTFTVSRQPVPPDTVNILTYYVPGPLCAPDALIFPFVKEANIRPANTLTNAVLVGQGELAYSIVDSTEKTVLDLDNGDLTVVTQLGDANSYYLDPTGTGDLLYDCPAEVNTDKPKDYTPVPNLNTSIQSQ